MKRAFSDLELDWAKDLLCSDADPNSEDFSDALSTLRAAVEAGMVQFAGLVAEIVAFPGPHHNAAVAYKFYYVSHAGEGYLVALANESDDPSHYLGPVGDFRNEAIVSDLVRELGLASLPALDSEAAILLSSGI
jgi:hypothetical protein